ncbi:MAG: alpha-galactosidase [Planctomycetes bacterium]|nr:alpha-galactosidase [Planctomycetota bacterium]
MNDLHEFIQGQLPAGWTLSDAELFRIHDNDGPIDFTLTSCSRESANSVSAVFSNNGLNVALTVTADVSRKAMHTELTVHNSGDVRYLTRIEALHLPWQSTEQPVYVRNCKGGNNQSSYPPEMYNERTVRADKSAYLWMENGFDGRSSDAHLPLMTVCNGDTAVSGGLAWSGLWWMYGSGNAQGARCFGCHIPVDNLQLAQGEELRLPAAHYVFSHGGLDGARNAMRRYIRESIVPQTTQPLRAQAIYNHWFGIGPDINAAVFKQQCDRAKTYGIDYVVLDAGWYGGCGETDFDLGVGNWDSIDHVKFPNGVEEVSNYAHQLGLKFGLWFELERAHRDSDWATKHPDWFIDIGSDFLHIDLSKNEVVDACIDRIQDAIDRYDCQWIKLDYNIGPLPYWKHKDPSGKIQFQYMEGLYRFLQTLRENNPAVLFENCASGGRRIDLATMQQTHVQFLSDQAGSAAICRYLMHGAQTFLPANICHVGMPFDHKEPHGLEDKDIRAFHVLSRFSGLPAIFGDIAGSCQKTQELMSELIALHRQYADVFHGDFFRLTPQAHTDSDCEAVVHLNADHSQGLLLIFSGHQEMAYAPHLRLDPLLNIADFQLSALHTDTDALQLAGSRLSEINGKMQVLPAESVLAYSLKN